jgi:hypothetical protein
MRCPRTELLLASFLFATISASCLAGPSVTASSDSKEFPAANAYDQNKGSRWGSEFSDPQWIEIDFGEEKDLVGLILFWEAAYGSSYEILCSRDRQSWKSVFKTDQGDGKADDILFERTRTRFVKIIFTRRGTGWGYSLFEVVPKTAAAPWGEGEVPDLFLLDEGGRVFVPAAWRNENPTLVLAGMRRRVDVKKTLTYDSFNTIDLQAKGAGPHGCALLAASDHALRQGLRQMLARDAKSCFELLAKIEPEGLFPYFLSGKQGYWTVVGVPDDFKDSLFCEDGTVEPYKSFTLSPFLSVDGKLFTREDARLTQSLENGFLPIPNVQWKSNRFLLNIKAFAAGAAGKSTTYVSYSIRNTGTKELSGQLHLAIRPFEINPPWQWGGLHRVPEVRFQNGTAHANDYDVVSLSPVSRFAKCSSNSVEIVQDLESGALEQPDPQASEYSSAALSYDFSLPAGGETNICVAIPLYPDAKPDRDIQPLAQAVVSQWMAEIPELPFYCPDRDVADSARATLAYILVNRDGPAIQPGSRSYEAAWMRDSVMMSGTLLRYSVTNVARAFMGWYAGYLMEDGRVPAIVIIGRNEVNPVKEFDSQGEFVYGLWDYYRFSGDKKFLEEMWPKAEKALRYLAQIRREEVDESRKANPDQARYYGILPKCVSHEGYYPEPGNHSYWDDFWALRGWKDAASIARVLGRTNQLDWIAQEEQALRDATYNSIRAAREFYKLDFIPGCAELGDFDPSSTAIAITACDELNSLPQPALTRTFDKYMEALRKRLEPGWKGSFSPYEFRIAQALIMMGRTHDARTVFEYLMTCRMPAGWRQWPEAVHFPPRTPGYIGDMPHTWAASGFLDALRSMYVYEDESKGNLMLAAGIPEPWITSDEIWFVRNAQTCWGPISYSMKRETNTLIATIRGPCHPPGKILFQSPGIEGAAPIAVTNLPATVRIELNP